VRADRRRVGETLQESTARSARRLSGGAIRTFLVDNGIFIAFILLCVALAFTSEHFLSATNLRNVLRQTSINGLLAIGMTFVILTGGIDLSVGSVLAFGGMAAAVFASTSIGEQYPLWVAVPIGLLAGVALGLVNGSVVAFFRVPPFVVTLGMLSIARGLTLITSNGMPVSRLSSEYIAIGQGVIYGVPVPVLIFFGVFGIAWVVLYHTTFGRYVYAVGGNEEAARISGVNARLVKFVVYGISGALAALGGIILSARTTAGLPQAGVAYELDAIAAVVIGGTSLAGGQGRLVGTLIGALIIGVVNNGLDLLGVSAYYQLTLKGTIIVAAVLLDSLRRR
jgi:putative xylitol transport system permease protein